MVMTEDCKVIADNGDFEYVVAWDNFTNNRVKNVIHQRLFTNARANLAEKLLSHFGILMCEPDGIDNGGRQKFKLMGVDEAVGRAVTMADAYWNEVDARGWVTRAPTYAETQTLGLAALSDDA